MVFLCEKNSIQETQKDLKHNKSLFLDKNLT